MALGPKVVNTLAASFSLFVEKTQGAMKKIIEIGIGSVFDAIGGESKKAFGPMLKEMIDHPDTPEHVKTFLKEYTEQTGQFGALVGGAMANSVASATMLSFLNPLLLPLTYSVNSLRPVVIPSPEDMITARFRGLLSPTLYPEAIKQHGYDAEAASILLENRRPLIPADLLRQLLLRGEIPESFHDEEMWRAGWRPGSVDLIKKLHRVIPSPGDLVRFELREVWRPEFRPGLLTPPPSGKFKAEMAKHGYSPDSADDFWAAHWELPSVGQGYEMHFRLPAFTEDRLRTLMRRLDILPEYHDELIKIAFRPFTRVDVRRMYRVGVLDRAGVKRAYLDLGYDEEKAEAMTAFTIKYETEVDRDLTRTDVLSGYKRGVFSRADAHDAMIDLGYSEDETTYLLTREDYKREEARADPYISRYKKLYTYGMITREDAATRLGALGILAEAVSEYLELWDLDREARVSDSAEVKERDLTRADITGGYRDGVIPREEAVAYLQSLGYDPGEAEFYLSREDFNLAKDTRDLSVATYRKLYTEGILGKTATTGALAGLGFSEPEIELLYSLWDIEREGRARRPTRADLVRFVGKDIITRDRYRQELEEMGYLPEVVEWYLEDLAE